LQQGVGWVWIKITKKVKVIKIKIILLVITHTIASVYLPTSYDQHPKQPDYLLSQMGSGYMLRVYECECNHLLWTGTLGVCLRSVFGKVVFFHASKHLLAPKSTKWATANNIR